MFLRQDTELLQSLAFLTLSPMGILLLLVLLFDPILSASHLFICRYNPLSLPIP
jgi:hypothetical protein